MYWDGGIETGVLSPISFGPSGQEKLQKLQKFFIQNVLLWHCSCEVRELHFSSHFFAWDLHQSSREDQCLYCCLLFGFLRRQKLSQSMTLRLNSKFQENKTMRMTWDLFGRQHFSFGLRSNVLWVEDQTVWSPHLDRLHHQPSRPIWSVKDLIKELFHSHCISGIMRPLKTLSVCTFLPNRNDLSEVILITALLIASSPKSGCVERCNPHFSTLELSLRSKVD